MKAALNNIIISLIFAVGGIIFLLFNLKGNQDWVLSWIGVLLAYLSSPKPFHTYSDSILKFDITSIKGFKSKYNTSNNNIKISGLK
nr:DUF3902 family protein [Bacillus nitratireducens]